MRCNRKFPAFLHSVKGAKKQIYQKKNSVSGQKTSEREIISLCSGVPFHALIGAYEPCTLTTEY